DEDPLKGKGERKNRRLVPTPHKTDCNEDHKPRKPCERHAKYEAAQKTGHNANKKKTFSERVCHLQTQLGERSQKCFLTFEGVSLRIKTCVSMGSCPNAQPLEESPIVHQEQDFLHNIFRSLLFYQKTGYSILHQFRRSARPCHNHWNA